jgi:hypothetical protein
MSCRHDLVNFRDGIFHFPKSNPEIPIDYLQIGDGLLSGGIAEKNFRKPKAVWTRMNTGLGFEHPARAAFGFHRFPNRTGKPFWEFFALSVLDAKGFPVRFGNRCLSAKR